MYELDDRVMILSDTADELQVKHERLRIAVERGKLDPVYRSASGRPYLRFGDARDYIERKRRRRPRF